MLEHMAVPDYIALKSPPLEGTINWKLHNMALVPGFSSPQLVLASGVHLFIFFSTLFHVKPVKRCYCPLRAYQNLSDQKYHASVYLSCTSKQYKYKICYNVYLESSQRKLVLFNFTHTPHLEFRLCVLALKDPQSFAPSYVSNLIPYCIPLLYATNTCLNASFVPDHSLQAFFHACTFQPLLVCQVTILLSLKSFSQNKRNTFLSPGLK